MNQIIEALKEYGTHDILGPQSNSKVLKYFKDIGHAWVTDDDTAWCSAFANYIMQKCGLSHTGKLNARSWLDIGIPVQTPQIGDIVIFWRENPKSALGHVAFFVADAGTYIWVLGGNQNDQVCIEQYPKARLLGYRHIS